MHTEDRWQRRWTPPSRNINTAAAATMKRAAAATTSLLLLASSTGGSAFMHSTAGWRYSTTASTVSAPSAPAFSCSAAAARGRRHDLLASVGEHPQQGKRRKTVEVSIIGALPQGGTCRILWGARGEVFVWCLLVGWRRISRTPAV